MLKYIFIPVIVIALSACNQSVYHQSLADSLHMADTVVKPITADRQIIPGQKVGQVHINEDADNVITMLGKPDSSDAAMGASLMTWNVKHNKTVGKLIIYAHRNMGAAGEAINHVKQIRVTLPWYKTTDYAGPGSELKDIQKIYKLKKQPAPRYGKKFSLYEDYAAGIGFEVDSTGKCLAVRVYAPQDSSGTYLNMQ
jgi:hypothetical protein